MLCVQPKFVKTLYTSSAPYPEPLRGKSIIALGILFLLSIGIIGTLYQILWLKSRPILNLGIKWSSSNKIKDGQD